MSEYHPAPPATLPSLAAQEAKEKRNEDFSEFLPAINSLR